MENHEQSFIIRYQNEAIRFDEAESRKGHSSADAPLSCTERKRSARQQRKEQKDVLKYSLYKLLTEAYREDPSLGKSYGDPADKIAMALIEAGMNNAEIADDICGKRYLISLEKTALAITIANREREILKDIDYENGYSLYVGIPFCPSICLYCSFSSYPSGAWKDRVELLSGALCKEIRDFLATL